MSELTSTGYVRDRASLQSSRVPGAQVCKIAKSDCYPRHLYRLCPSVRVEKLDFHWSDFHEILYLSIVLKLVIKFKFHYNLTIITGTLHEDRCTFLILSRSFLLRMRNV